MPSESERTIHSVLVSAHALLVKGLSRKVLMNTVPTEQRGVIVPKPPSLAQIKKELDARRRRVKEEFEGRIGEAQRKAEFHRMRIKAERKRRDAKIAKIEEDFGRRAAAALEKRLGREKYRQLEEWLLRKKKEEIRRLETSIRPTENEDYQRQLAELKDTSSVSRLLTLYFNNKNKFEEELRRDTGLEV